MPPAPIGPPHAGPARFTLKAYQPHFSRPSIVAGPEYGRLVLRTPGQGRGKKGEALCEAAYGPPPRGAEALPPGAPAGIEAAVAPRADVPLMAALLAIYRSLLTPRPRPRPQAP